MPIRDPNTVYFCVDLEASGPVPGLFNLVSIAGVTVRLEGDRHVRGEAFYHELKPICDGFVPEAEAIYKLTRQHLETHGLDAKDALAQVAAFVKRQVGPGQRPLFVGHNAPFDWMYTAWYFAWAGMENPFGYNALDTKALAMGIHRLPWKQTNKETIQALHPSLTPPAPELVHHALADAEFQADILIALLDHTGA